jgi:hypothetical protein
MNDTETKHTYPFDMYLFMDVRGAMPPSTTDKKNRKALLMLPICYEQQNPELRGRIE